jgi:integrase
MATWIKDKQIWRSSLGTGKNRKFFYGSTEEEAERHKARYLEGPKKCRPGSVNEFFEQFWWPHIEKDKSVETGRTYISHYANDIEPVFGNALLKEINAMHIQRWVNTLREKHPEGNKTVVNKYTTFSSLLTMAWRLGAISESFKGKIILPSVTKRHPLRDLTPGLRLKCLEAVEDTHYYGPVWAMSTFGMRRNEALGLRPSDITLNEKGQFGIITLRMNRQKRETKEQLKNRDQGEQRWFAVPIDMARQLLSYQIDSDPNSFLFRDREGKPVHPETLSESVHRRWRAVGISLEVKQLRNLMISSMRRAGISDQVRMDIVGHEQESTHSIYQDKTIAEFVGAFSRLQSAYDTGAGENDIPV